VSERLSRERLNTIIRMVVSARGPKVADEIADHIAALEAENASFRALVETHEEVKADLKAENERLREALRLIADTTVSQASAHIAEAALDEEVEDRNDIDQICRDNSAAVEEMMAANRGGGGVSNQKMCPLLAAGVMASPSDRIAEKIQAGWDLCQGIDCQWWDTEQGECSVVPK
jgi:hypothetical protein